ncbi:hypothetical protein EL17_16675 [Anditalea andensis]|uniref:Lipocalin-like domain-containing protein n=2 Tax=Anditalea andensis TaxID=1048983 RepID=A0A074KVU2_9BACT|nr:hypothetical protein EL17_16675 [Anditalea andensis]
MEFNENELKFDHELIGAWSNIEYNELGMTMSKVNNLEKNIYGYVFNTNGTMVARMNSGWCGTPPIITQDYEGTWKIGEDEKILVSVGDWMGNTTQEWLVSFEKDKRVSILINHSSID